MTSVQNQQLSSVIVKLKLVGCHPTMYAQGPHSHILMTGGGGGGPKDFLGSDILAKRDFFWVYERRRDFFGSRKQHRDFFGYCIFHQLKSTIA